MWNLLMGGTYSSEEEEVNIETEEVIVDKENLENVVKEKNEEEIASLHKSDPSSKLEIHRIPSPTRECGDGSDAVPDTDHSAKLTVESIEAKALKKYILLPKTNIKLEKLPPIKDASVQLPQREPTSPLVPLSLAHPRRMNKIGESAKKDKQPKFVPYEPYKAAITPIVASSNPRKRLSSSKSSLEQSNSAEDPGANFSDQEQQQDSKAVEALNMEIRKLKTDLDEKDKQLKIQTQINCEVKRLLVASVGEDIEAKVDFLTQDKARLSADIRQYTSKITRDFEEKEQLSVESTLWKSKFLACSVVVDELARWKASLLHRNEEFEHNVRLLFHEHSVLWATLVETYTTLARLRSAFDPLAASLAPAEVASLLGMADHTLNVAKLLRSRLMGETKLKPMDLKTGQSFVPSPIDTPAEEGLKYVIATPVNDASSEYSELASLAVTGVAKSHLMKMGDKLNTPTGFSNCTHCHGVVQNI